MDTCTFINFDKILLKFGMQICLNAYSDHSFKIKSKINIFFSKKGSPVFAFSICLSVCLCDRGLQATGLGCWFLAWRILRWTIRNLFFFFLFFEILRFDLLMKVMKVHFSDFWEFFFYIYPLLILKESVDRTKWHRYLKFGIWDLYRIINGLSKAP